MWGHVFNFYKVTNKQIHDIDLLFSLFNFSHMFVEVILHNTFSKNGFERHQLSGLFQNNAQVLLYSKTFLEGLFTYFRSAYQRSFSQVEQRRAKREKLTMQFCRFRSCVPQSISLLCSRSADCLGCDFPNSCVR